MRKLLIADTSEQFIESLVALLRPKFDICTCTDGTQALRELQTFRPDYMVLNIHLSGCDGIALLRQTAHRPSHILALTRLASPYTLQMLSDLGVEYALLLPCTLQAVACHLDTMLRISLLPKNRHDPHDIIRQHLRILGFCDGQAGFYHLCTELALYAQDPYQSLSKELHPAVAQICGDENGDQVESKIRRLIAEVWEARNPAIWKEYFPDMHDKPKLHTFLRLMATKLNLFTELLALAQN